MRVSTYYVCTMQYVPWCFIKDLFRVSRNFCVQYLTPHVYVLRVSPFFCSLLHFPAKLHSVTMWPKAILLYKPKVFYQVSGLNLRMLVQFVLGQTVQLSMGYIVEERSLCRQLDILIRNFHFVKCEFGNILGVHFAITFSEL